MSMSPLLLLVVMKEDLAAYTAVGTTSAGVEIGAESWDAMSSSTRSGGGDGCVSIFAGVWWRCRRGRGCSMRANGNRVLLSGMGLSREHGKASVNKGSDRSNDGKEGYFDNRQSGLDIHLKQRKEEIALEIERERP